MKSVPSTREHPIDASILVRLELARAACAAYRHLLAHGAYPSEPPGPSLRIVSTADGWVALAEPPASHPEVESRGHQLKAPPCLPAGLR